MKAGFPGKIFGIKYPVEFQEAALEIFHYQTVNNKIYDQFIRSLGVRPEKVFRLDEIPFMPIEFFRYHEVITGEGKAETVFESTGTTGVKRSRHYITDLALYDRSLLEGFRYFYGDPEQYFIVALLPSYIDRPSSSLVYMVRKLIDSGADRRSCFVQEGSRKLINLIRKVLSEGRKAMLIGVSFALLDFAEKHKANLKGLIVVETGGMKGRRKEITREELHSVLIGRLGIETVHSEYGMTELLSQAWSQGGGLFSCPPWMQVMVREINDPLAVSSLPGKSGGINIIDLANINSCSFIATGDLGRLHEGDRFEVLGRFDHSEIRGCNLMAE